MRADVAGLKPKPVCGRCQRDAHEKCLARGNAMEGVASLSCFCGCWDDERRSNERRREAP